MPSTVVSRYFSSPEASQPHDLLDELRLEVGVVADEHALEAQPLADDQRHVARAGVGSVALYWAIIPQMVARPCTLNEEIAASRCSPPTLSK